VAANEPVSGLRERTARVGGDDCRRRRCSSERQPGGLLQTRSPRELLARGSGTINHEKFSLHERCAFAAHSTGREATECPEHHVEVAPCEELDLWV
jgi:hypothetical protein